MHRHLPFLLASGLASHELDARLDQHSEPVLIKHWCSNCGAEATSELCFACEGRELQDDERRTRVVDFASWLGVFGVPSRYRSVGADWLLPPNIRDWRGDPWSLTVLGPTGTGKTSLAVAVLGRLGAYLGDGFFISTPELIRAVVAEIRGRRSRVSERAIEAEVLLLDDLGSERSGEFSLSEISSVICARYDRIKPTIVTSNLDLDGIEPRLASRLASGVVLRLQGRDRRIKHVDRNETV